MVGKKRISAGRFDLLGAEHYAVVIREITLRRESKARQRQHGGGAGADCNSPLIVTRVGAVTVRLE